MNKLAGKKILIVDDEEDLLDILEFNLIRKEIKVFKALSGIEAFDIVRRNKIDVVISDIMMPGLGADGITLARRCMELEKCPLLIVVSANSFDDSTDPLAKVLTFFLKPYQFTKIFDYIESKIS